MNGLCSRLHVTFPTLSQTRNSAGRTGHGILSWSHRCPGWRQCQPRCRCQLCSGQSLAWGAAQWRTGAKMRWWHIDSEMIHICVISPDMIGLGLSAYNQTHHSGRNNLGQSCTYKWSEQVNKCMKCYVQSTFLSPISTHSPLLQVNWSSEQVVKDIIVFPKSPKQKKSLWISHSWGPEFMYTLCSICKNLNSPMSRFWKMDALVAYTSGLLVTRMVHSFSFGS